MTEKFYTEAEIEKELERFRAPIKDSNGQYHNIEAANLTWNWYFIITHDPNFPSEGIMDDVVEWRRTEHPNQSLSYIFEEYIANIVHNLGESARDLERNFKSQAKKAD